MRRGYLPGILAGACILLGGCPTPTGTENGDVDPPPPPPPPQPVNLNEAIDVVGADWKESSLALKDTGGPTVAPPKLTSNSSKSFDVEVAEVGADHTLDDVAQLAFAIEPFGGHYVFDVGPDDRTPAGSILVTVVQEQAELTPGAFTLQVGAADAAGNEVAIPDVSAAFFAASAGDDSMAGVGETVALEATFTGETGPPQVTWSQVAGPDAIIADASSAKASFVPATVGTYVLKLEAVDPTGVIDVDLVSILVVDEFTVDAGESGVIMVDDIVCLHGLAAGGTGQATFAWTEISDHGVTIEDTDSCDASFVVLETGEHEFELTATDDIGDTASDRVIYLAVDGLTARIDAPDQAELGATIQLRGQAGGGLYPYAFRWTQTDGPEVDIENSTNQTALVSPETADDYSFELRVEDSTPSSATDSVTILVVPQGDSECDDGNACTTDTYDADAGECSYDAIICDDEDACTEDSCDVGSGCIFTDIVCDENTVCVEGVCKPICTTAANCDDGEFCNGAETCTIPDGGGQAVCGDGTPVECEEGWECDEGVDTCVDPCADVVCNENEVCDKGECSVICQNADDCDDGKYCNGAETCADGLCELGTFPCGLDEICLEDTEECRACDTFLFCDNFDGASGGWFADNGIWELGVPTSGPGESYSPEQLAATVLAGNIPAGTSSGLVSPSIQLPVISAEDEIHLRFWHWFTLGDRCGGWCVVEAHVQIREQTAPGQWGTWTTLQSFGRSSGVYTNSLVDLSGYAGERVQIRFFIYQSGNGLATAGWYVDDVTIEVN